MGPIGLPEAMAIFVIALLLFGPKKLPELGRTLGKAISEFRRASNELKSTFESHLNELERETNAVTRPSELATTATDSHYSGSSYSYPYENYNNYESAQQVHTEPAAAPPSAHSATAVENADVQRSADVPAPGPVSGTIPRQPAAVKPNVTPPATEEGQPS